MSSPLAPINAEEAFVMTTHRGEQVVSAPPHGSKSKRKISRKCGWGSTQSRSPPRWRWCRRLLMKILPLIYWQDLRNWPKQLAAYKPKRKQLRVVALPKLRRLHHLHQMRMTPLEVPLVSFPQDSAPIQYNLPPILSNTDFRCLTRVSYLFNGHDLNFIIIPSHSKI